MARILYGPGAHCGVVGDLQRALAAAGCDPQGMDDDFGGKTLRAVKAFQQKAGLPQTGNVDDTTWAKLMKQPIPPADVRALELTAAFEGHGYTKAEGNWDGALITWGIIGYTWKHGEIQKIIRNINQAKPKIIADSFGAGAAEILKAARGTPEAQKAWALAVNTPEKRLSEPWVSRFRWFGESPVVQTEQRRLARLDYAVPAQTTAAAMGLTSELGFALCFDIHVQNGGIKKEARAAIRAAMDKKPPASEKDLRCIIANAVADAANNFNKDVRARKLTIATGAGRVHGRDYVVANWAVGENPV